VLLEVGVHEACADFDRSLGSATSAIRVADARVRRLVMTQGEVW